MFEAYILLIVMGAFGLLLCVADTLFMLFGFIWYKRDKGKMNFRQYAKWWGF